MIIPKKAQTIPDKKTLTIDEWKLNQEEKLKAKPKTEKNVCIDRCSQCQSKNFEAKLVHVGSGASGANGVSVNFVCRNGILICMSESQIVEALKKESENSGLKKVTTEMIGSSGLFSVRGSSIEFIHFITSTK